jgi:hypothetical protein
MGYLQSVREKMSYKPTCMIYIKKNKVATQPQNLCSSILLQFHVRGTSLTGNNTSKNITFFPCKNSVD